MTVYIDKYDKRGCDLSMLNRPDSFDRPLMAIRPVRLTAQWIDAHRDDPRRRVRIVARQIPNAITVGRVFLAIPVAMVWLAALASLQATPTAVHTIIAAVFFGLAVIVLALDALDGTLASQGNVVSDFGRFVDPLGDKFVIMAFYYTLWLASQQMLSSDWRQWLAGIVVADVIINSCTGSVGLAQGLQKSHRPSFRPLQAEIWGKAKANAQGAAIFCWGIGLMASAHYNQAVCLVFMVAFAGLMVGAIIFGLASLRSHWRRLTGSHGPRSKVARRAAAVAIVSGTVFWLSGNNNELFDPTQWLVLVMVSSGLGFGFFHRYLDDRLISSTSS